MIMGAIAALAQAEITPQKAAYLKSRGVDVDRFATTITKHRSMAEPYMAQARKRSNMLQQGEVSPEQVQALIGDNAAFYEAMFLGAIDGAVSDFNTDCKGGLANTVRNAFSVLDTYQIWLPKNTAKFNLANVGLTEASNIVYAHCSVAPVTRQLAQLADYENPDQYIIVASRVMGAFVNTIPELRGCIDKGNKIGDGFMVGFCGAEMAVTLLDVSL